jgi:hypothetical protein
MFNAVGYNAKKSLALLATALKKILKTGIFLAL